MLDQNISAMTSEALMTLDGETRLKLFLQSEQPNLLISKIDRLSGDASTRQYFRVQSADSTYIAAVYQESFDPDRQPFLDITMLFMKVQLPVPGIVAASGRFGIIIQLDLGDLRLQDWLDTVSPSERAAAYRESIGLILSIQAATDRAVEAASCCAGIAFDEAKLMWELEFFYRHYFKSYLQSPLEAERESALLAELRAIAVELAARPRVLCHRDFHSRNLMLWQGRQFIIDYQDARMGPQTYDLASLLRDPYVELSEELIAELYDDFMMQKCSREATPEWRQEMRDEFELMTVQRIIKAIGTYAYQTAVVKNNVYVGYIPRAIATALAAAERLGRFPVLRELLAEQVQRARA